MAIGNKYPVSEADSWVTQLGMENDYKWYVASIERMLYKMEDLIQTIKERLTENLHEEEVSFFYSNKIVFPQLIFFVSVHV
jgi:hypothetical protein